MASPTSGVTKPDWTKRAWSRLLRGSRGRILAAALLVALVALQYFADLPMQRALRLMLFDAYQTIAPRIRVSAPAVIVEIDEASLARYGQWPWPRTLLSRLLTGIATGHPAAMGIDIIMPEPDRMSASRLAESMPGIDRELAGRLSKLPTNDAVLAATIKGLPVVLGSAGLESQDTDSSKTPLRHAPFIAQGGDPQPYLRHFVDTLRSLDEIDEAAAGHAVLSADHEGGVIRRVPLVSSVGDALMPSLSIEMLRVASGQPAFRLRVGTDGIEGVGIGDLFIPTQVDGRVWVYYTPHDRNRFVSAADVLSGKTDFEQFEKKLVLIGLTGIGLLDYQVTPLGERVPGVEIHAQVLEGIFDGKLLSRPEWASWAEAPLLAVWGLLVILAVPALRPIFSVLAVVVFGSVVVGIGFLLYKQFGILFDVASPAAGAAFLFGATLGVTLSETDTQRRRLKRELEAEREAAALLAGELQAAQRIQTGILPKPSEAFPGETRFDLSALLEPAKLVGGDLYDFFMLDQDNLSMLIGDVSGKGLPASLFMAVSKALYKSAAMRSSLQVGEVMREANVEISRDNPETLFVTAFSGILNVKTGRLEYCIAGHDAPYVLIPGREKVEKLNGGGGPPICVMEDYRYDYETVVHNMAPGEALCVITDGVTEAMNAGQELYGHARLEQTLSGIKTVSSASLVLEAVRNDVKSFVGGAEPADDLTILVVRWNGNAAAAGQELT